MASRLVWWVLALLAGALWGVAFFSWVGMGVSSSFVVLLSGDLFEWWMLVPVIALLGAAVLHALSIGFLRGG